MEPVEPQDNSDRPESLGSPEARFLALVNSSWVTQAVYVAARLGLADLLAGGPRAPDDLAGAAGAHAPSLRRLLRALATLEIVREREDGAFELLPTGAFLRSDGETSLRSWALMVGGYQWQTWGRLLESVRTGQSARTLLYGTEGFEHLERDPEWAAVFHQAMVEVTRLVTPGLVRAYDFSALKRLVDVGGGYGALLAAILAANPGARGVLFDQVHALGKARAHLERAGLADRCELVAGSFFEAVPEGADAYLLKSILHDWNDERCRVILENCRRAMKPGAKLLVVERLMPGKMEASAAHRNVVRSDLNMMVSLAALERTEAQFRSLLESAGLRLDRTIPADGGFYILEAAPV